MPTLPVRPARPAALTTIALIGATIALPASADDAATLNILGFSADGATFAFEEYGVQGGSGFPFANRFYIDTATDTFVSGTPIRVRIDDETASVAQVRAQAQAQGETIIADAVLDENAGFLAGFNAITELSADPHRIVVAPREVVLPFDAPLEYRIEEIVFEPGDTCFDLREREIGFRLLSINAQPGGVTEVLHEDTSVPASRGCPQGYTFGGVQIFHPADGPMIIAVVLSVESLGFEGSDFSWMAVTTQQPISK